MASNNPKAPAYKIAPFKSFSAIPRWAWMVDLPGKGGALRLVLLALITHDHPDAQGRRKGVVWPSQKGLAADAGLNASTVNAHLATLEELGLVAVERTRKTARVTIRYPEDIGLSEYRERGKPTNASSDNPITRPRIIQEEKPKPKSQVKSKPDSSDYPFQVGTESSMGKVPENLNVALASASATSGGSRTAPSTALSVKPKSRPQLKNLDNPITGLGVFLEDVRPSDLAAIVNYVCDNQRDISRLANEHLIPLRESYGPEKLSAAVELLFLRHCDSEGSIRYPEGWLKDALAEGYYATKAERECIPQARARLLNEVLWHSAPSPDDDDDEYDVPF